MNSSPVRHRLYLVAAALLFSTGGVAVKATSMTGWQVASFRSAIAAAILLMALPEARRRWTPGVAGVGLAYAATLVLFVLATKLTTAANAIFLQATAPLYVLLAGPWLLRESVGRSDRIYGLAVGAGMALFFVGVEPAASTAPDPFTGNLFGAVTGMTWAVTIMGLRGLGRGGSENLAAPTVAAGNVFAFVAVLPMALPLHSPTTGDILAVLYLGIVQIAIPYILLTRAIRHVPAFEATTIILLEPVMNPVWTWLVHEEQPSPWALCGGVIILGATLIHTWRRKW